MFTNMHFEWIYFHWTNIVNFNKNFNKDSKEKILFSQILIRTAAVGGQNFCLCGNTIKSLTQYPTTCTYSCCGNSAECCGDSTTAYYSVYSDSKLNILNLIIFVGLNFDKSKTYLFYYLYY